MEIFYDIPAEANGTAVALGFFDGVHAGHRDVLSAAAKEEKNGLTSVCFTFSKSPAEVIGGEKIYSIMTREDKLAALEKIGIKHTCFADFKSLMNLSAREFAEKILFERLRAQKLFCGFNYRFGRRAEGDVRLLGELCENRGASLTVIPPHEIGGMVVSSTQIKILLCRGEVERANKMLCAPFGFKCEIVHGRRLGRELGTPTLNMTPPDGIIMPKFGVYASEVTLESGARFCGVTNVGIKPTVGGKTPLWETWMPDYHGGEIYGQQADVRLLSFIRPEKKFDSLDELKRRIIENGEQARLIYAEKRRSE